MAISTRNSKKDSTNELTSLNSICTSNIVSGSIFFSPNQDNKTHIAYPSSGEVHTHTIDIEIKLDMTKKAVNKDLNTINQLYIDKLLNNIINPK